MTYNRRLTEMIVRGEVNEREDAGIRVYSVPPPELEEIVVGYVNFAQIIVPETETKAAQQ